MKRVLVAGATGYLGRFITEELVKQKYFTKVLVRNTEKYKRFNIKVDKIIHGEVTNRLTLKDCCKDIDIVISTVGITRQKDGLSYMDVDYKANLNLLDEAKKNGIKKFIYISVLNAEKMKNLSIIQAKIKFTGKLKQSGLDYAVIYPNGFFSDMTEFYNMARKGRIYLLGSGEQKANPIHGEDLAKVCVSAIEGSDKDIEVGGPDTLTQNEIAKLAFDAAGKLPKITHIPDWIRKIILNTSKLFMNSKNFGPIEFFLNVMAIDMVAPKYGNHQLQNFFMDCKDKI